MEKAGISKECIDGKVIDACGLCNCGGEVMVNDVEVGVDVGDGDLIEQ